MIFIVHTYTAVFHGSGVSLAFDQTFFLFSVSFVPALQSFTLITPTVTPHTLLASHLLLLHTHIDDFSSDLIAENTLQRNKF